MAGKPRNTPETIWERVSFDPGGCWSWKGRPTHQGYGVMHLHGKAALAHRVSYELTYGAIPEGATIDHLCRTRECINPLHLEAVSNGENILRGASPPAKNARKTHCNSGHELTQNKYGRGCRPCALAKHREWVANNPERHAELTNAWRAANPTYHAEWSRANRERLNELQRERRRKAKEAAR